MARWSKLILLSLLSLLWACAEENAQIITGHPPGPYEMTLTTPTQIKAGEETTLTTKITNTGDGTPIKNLRTLHERLVHNFIIKSDHSHFSHLHHEDFKPLTEVDIDSATLSFPYTFPKPGQYRLVSEFTDSKRSWTKHFDVQVGPSNNQIESSLDYTRISKLNGFKGTLSMSPEVPVAGAPIEMMVRLDKNNLPVNDLQLWLGSEAHVAIWKHDGKYFGHTHSYTPSMKKMMRPILHKKQAIPTDPAMMKKMMLKLMSQPAALIYKGPTIPLFFIFPHPGKYIMYVECAPSGQRIVFQFVFEVLPGTQKVGTNKYPVSESVEKMM